ncbi:MAG: PKD domain-containing protein, partial [Candidatus Lutacidiplasmatales archaeon]
GDTWTFPAPALDLQLDTTPRAAALLQPLNLTANVTGGAGPLVWNWSFGDGSANGSGASVSHTYSATGAYVVHLTVEDAQGREMNRSLSVKVITALSAGASGTPTQGEAPLRVNFTANSSGGLGPFQYSWAFGDQTTGGVANASHVYLAGGTYTATVTVRDAAREVRRASVNISVASPLGVAVRTTPSTPIGDVPLLVNFTAEPTGTESPFRAVWDFGDGSPTVSTLNASHTYSTSGAFAAKVTVTDAVGHQANASVAVQVSGPLTASISATRTSGIAPLSVTLAAITGNGTAPFQYDWSFGDGSANATGVATTHVYLNAGTYTLQLTTTDAVGNHVLAKMTVVVVTTLD